MRLTPFALCGADSLDGTNLVFIRKLRNSAVPRWAGAFMESLVWLYGKMATARKSPEACRLTNPCKSW
jgi:hypothetical protein